MGAQTYKITEKNGGVVDEVKFGIDKGALTIGKWAAVRKMDQAIGFDPDGDGSERASKMQKLAEIDTNHIIDACKIEDEESRSWSSAAKDWVADKVLGAAKDVVLKQLDAK